MRPSRILPAPCGCVKLSSPSPRLRGPALPEDPRLAPVVAAAIQVLPLGNLGQMQLTTEQGDAAGTSKMAKSMSDHPQLAAATRPEHPPTLGRSQVDVLDTDR